MVRLSTKVCPLAQYVSYKTCFRNYIPVHYLLLVSTGARSRRRSAFSAIRCMSYRICSLIYNGSETKQNERHQPRYSAECTFEAFCKPPLSNGRCTQVSESKSTIYGKGGARQPSSRYPALQRKKRKVKELCVLPYQTIDQSERL